MGFYCGSVFYGIYNVLCLRLNYWYEARSPCQRYILAAELLDVVCQATWVAYV